MSADGLETPPTRVLLLEPNAALRSAIQTLLTAENYQVVACESLQDILNRTDGGVQTVGLVAWQSMGGLLAEEHRDELLAVGRRLPLVVMVPRRWERLLHRTNLRAAVGGLIAKPFEADELLDSLNGALAATPDEVEAG